MLGWRRSGNISFGSVPSGPRNFSVKSAHTTVRPLAKPLMMALILSFFLRLPPSGFSSRGKIGSSTVFARGCL